MSQDPTTPENYPAIRAIANDDVDVLIKKGATYGRSWVKRGGTGAFMMLARKWDRIENIVENASYDILDNGFEKQILEEIADLRRYLLLVEAELRVVEGRPLNEPAFRDTPASRSYVDQD